MTRPQPHHQRGLALAVVMIMLLILTLIGLASMRSTLLQERMAAASRDRGLSFQAAEVALRRGEQVAAARANPPTVVDCRQQVRNAVTGVWEAVATPPVCPPEPASWAGATTVSTEQVNLGGSGTGTAQPQFIVELLAENVPNPSSCTTTIDISEPACTQFERRYRVTARSTAAGRATVVLQSIFAVP